jgi:hypothetical protein
MMQLLPACMQLHSTATTATAAAAAAAAVAAVAQSCKLLSADAAVRTAEVNVTFALHGCYAAAALETGVHSGSCQTVASVCSWSSTVKLCCIQ